MDNNYTLPADKEARALTKENTDCMKGILALIVLACHLRGQIAYLNDTVIGQMLTVSGYLAVSVFFFFSGYGLQSSWNKKGDMYIHTFFQKRILPFYCTYLFATGIYVVYYVLSGNHVWMCDINVLQVLLFGTPIVLNGWYLQTILVMYVFFWLTYYLLKQPTARIGLIVILTSVYYGVCWWLGYDSYWFISIFAFPLGLIWCQIHNIVADRLKSKKAYSTWLLSLGSVFGILLFLGNYPIGFLPDMRMFKTLSAVFFPVLVVVLMMKVRINYKITKKLGNIYFEIYVTHGLWMHVFQRVFGETNDFLYVICVFSTTVISSVLLHPVFVWINRFVTV